MGTEGFLDPQDIQRMRSMAMVRAGLGILAGSKGPQGTLNMGRDIGSALDQGAGYMQNATQQLIQNRMSGYQLRAQQGIMQIMSGRDPSEIANPSAQGGAGPGADYMDNMRHLVNVQTQLTGMGPMGVEMASRLTPIIDANRQAALAEEGDPREIKTDSGPVLRWFDKFGKPIPDPSSPSGFRDEPLYSMKAPEQLAHYTTEVKPHSEDAALAYQQYRSLEPLQAGPITGDSRIRIAMRAQLAARIMGLPSAGSLTAYQNPDVLEQIPEVGHLLASWMNIGRITEADAQDLDRSMIKMARDQKKYVEGTLIPGEQKIGGHGELSPGDYIHDLWSNIDLGDGESAAPAAPPPATSGSARSRVLGGG
jgi:hypothetical protein